MAIKKPPHWAYIAGLIITAAAAFGVMTKGACWIWDATAAVAVQRQIEGTLKPHCEAQDKTETKIAARLDTLTNRITANQEEMRVNNAEMKTMLRILVRKVQ